LIILRLIYSILSIISGLRRSSLSFIALLRSELKQKVLLSLLKGDKKLADLKADVETTDTTILHVLKEFEKLNLTTKLAGMYSLSSLGLIEAQICKDSYNTAQVMEKFREFWLLHDITPIPSQFLNKLGMLQEAEILKSELSSLGKVHETFLKMMVNTKKVFGASPIFHSDFVAVFKEVLNSGGKVDLIVTNEVFNKTLESAISTHDGELFQKFLVNGQLRVYLLDDLKIALTVTEKIFSLGLFHLNGEYDYTTDLISINPLALQWGEEIFHEYLRRAEKVNFG
jgi:predicted transcriptional regulator